MRVGIALCVLGAGVLALGVGACERGNESGQPTVAATSSAAGGQVASNEVTKDITLQVLGMT